MICIKVYGSNSDKRLKRLLHDVSYFYLKQLLPRKRNIRIKIQLVKGLVESEKVFGDCYQCYKDDPDEDYIIRLHHDESYHAIMVVLAHEFVHLKQYDRRELVLYSGDNEGARWKGVYCSEYDYDSAPWEKEADEYELELYMTFFENCSLLKEYK
jgi:hypothetical protein